MLNGVMVSWLLFEGNLFSQCSKFTLCERGSGFVLYVFSKYFGNNSHEFLYVFQKSIWASVTDFFI